MGILCTGERLLSRIEKIWVAVAATAVITMMFFTALDVVFRYGFNSPLTWWYDVLMNYLLFTPFFLSFSYTLAHHGHLAVEFFARKFHPPTMHAFMAIAYAAASIVLSGITVLTAIESYEAWHKGDVIAGVILWPVWLGKAIVVVGMFPLSLRCLHFSIGHLISVRDQTALIRLEVANLIEPDGATI